MRRDLQKVIGTKKRNTTPSQGVEIVDKMLKKNGIELHYPQITSNVEGKDKINGRLQQEVQKQYEEYMKDENLETAKGNYKITYNKDSLLSLFNQYDTYYSGAAHPLSYFSSHTFNTVTGADYLLKDLFFADSNYLEGLTAYVKKFIQEQNIQTLLPFEGVKENDRFYITPTGALIYYQIYEYTPYGYGLFAIPVPFEVLEPYLDPQNPLSQLQSKQ